MTAGVAAGLLAIGIAITLIILGVHIGFALGIVAFLGYASLYGLEKAILILGLDVWNTGTGLVILCLPFFLLLGQIIQHTGLAEGIYEGVYRWLGRLPGGLAMATTVACGIMGAAVGDSMSGTAMMGAIALPEMDKYKYSRDLSIGCITTGGTLGVLVPPSIPLIVYGLLTLEPIGRLFVAAIIPGIFSVVAINVMIFFRVKFNPEIAPLAPAGFTFKDRIQSIPSMIPVGLVFFVIIGGLYTGFFTATEGGAVACVVAVVMAIVTGKASISKLIAAIRGGMQITAMVMLLVIGGLWFGVFIAKTGLSTALIMFVGDLAISPYLILTGILVIYAVLGMIMNPLPVLLLTIPIIYPMAGPFGWDPIWLAIVLTISVELACILPPIGINILVIKGIAPETPLGVIYRSVVWFLVTDVIIVAILIIFPQLTQVLRL